MHLSALDTGTYPDMPKEAPLSAPSCLVGHAFDLTTASLVLLSAVFSGLRAISPQKECSDA